MKKLFFLLLMLFVSSCVTCLSKEEMEILVSADPFATKDLSRFDGTYIAKKFSLWGKEVRNNCPTVIKDGKVRTQDFEIIHLVDPQLILETNEEKIFEFQDGEYDYQLYERAGEYDLVSVHLWLTLEKESDETKKEDLDAK